MKAKAATPNVQAFFFQVFVKMGKLVNGTYIVIMKNWWNFDMSFLDTEFK